MKFCLKLIFCVFEDLFFEVSRERTEAFCFSNISFLSLNFYVLFSEEIENIFIRTFLAEIDKTILDKMSFKAAFA